LESLRHVVVVLLNGGSWTAAERKLLETAGWAMADDVDQSTLLLLYWLRYGAAIGQQQEHYVDHSVLIWRLRNLHPVLRALGLSCTTSMAVSSLGRAQSDRCHPVKIDSVLLGFTRSARGAER